jgi:hypothetical protein
MAQRDRYRKAWSHDIQVIGGLTAISLGLAAVLIIAMLAVVFVRKDATQVAIVASSAFAVIGTLVGAYFGMKIGTDQTKAAMEQTDRATKAMREEAAKAQAFASQVETGAAADWALRAAHALAFGEALPPPPTSQSSAPSEPVAQTARRARPSTTEPG